MTNDAASTPDDAEPGVYDPDILADLADLFGQERLAQLLAGLDDEIVRRVEGAASDRDGLGADAHVLVSVSGTLGFAGLSQACAALEQACLAGGDVASLLTAAQREAARARHAISGLRAGPG